MTIQLQFTDETKMTEKTEDKKSDKDKKSDRLNKTEKSGRSREKKTSSVTMKPKGADIVSLNEALKGKLSNVFIVAVHK